MNLIGPIKKIPLFIEYLLSKRGGEERQKKIVILIVYFGIWPEWITLYMESCRFNPSINWLLFTDAGEPHNKPENVKSVPMTLDDFNQLASRKLGISVRVSDPYKLCDFKSTFGVIFDDYLKGYDFWGHGDIDVIYGNLRRFLTPYVLAHDVISFHRYRISGHLAFYGNSLSINQQFTQIEDWQNKLKSAKYEHLDEEKMFLIINKNRSYLTETYSTPCKFNPWKDGTFDFPTEWYWQNGKLTNNKDDSEYPYFHFMVWKGSQWEENKLSWNASELSQEILHFEGITNQFKITQDGFFKL